MAYRRHVMFRELSLSFQKPFKNFTPYPKADDRRAWADIDSETRKLLIKKGEQFLGYDYPYLKASDFMEFSKTGNRTNYENKLFAKRKALDALVLAECAENQGRFLDDIINGIYAVCNETAWQLPAHNTYIRDAKQFVLPDTTHPVLELFSCETAAVLATVYYLLENRLNDVSPFICTMIKDELKKRVITPYLTRHFWWMGNGNEPMCNWTVWCTQNILLTAFLIPWSSSVRERVFRKAAGSIDFFLKDYGEDGCCEEGAQYYRHAGLCLFQSLDILCRITENHFAVLWQNEKMKNIASYILNVHVDDKYYINFADCSPVAGRAGTREFLFGKACKLPELMAFAASDYRRNDVVLQPEENNLYYRLQEVFTRKEILSYETPAAPRHPSVYYPSVGLFLVRNGTYTAGVKSGDNDDSHNHNDTGSVTVYKNGLPLLIDIGVESYTAKTFSPKRYEIWTMQSDFHNLPTINGQMQQNGKSFHADVLDYNFTKDGGTFRMDIANAYPKETGIKSYIREFSLTQDGVSLTDRFEFQKNCGGEVILNFMTYEKPELLDNQIKIGSLGELNWNCSAQVTIEEFAITDERLALCWKHSIYRIRLALCDTGRTGAVKIGIL